jgi:hypothetical protein
MASNPVFAQNQAQNQDLGLQILQSTPEARFSFYDPLKFTFGDFIRLYNSEDKIVANGAKIYLTGVIEVAESTMILCSYYSRNNPLKTIDGLGFHLRKIDSSRHKERAVVVLLDILSTLPCMEEKS